MNSETKKIVSNLRYQGNQYTTGEVIRGGMPRFPHYLIRAADLIERLEAEKAHLRYEMRNNCDAYDQLEGALERSEKDLRSAVITRNASLQTADELLDKLDKVREELKAEKAFTVCDDEKQELIRLRSVHANVLSERDHLKHDLKELQEKLNGIRFILGQK